VSWWASASNRPGTQWRGRQARCRPADRPPPVVVPGCSPRRKRNRASGSGRARLARHSEDPSDSYGPPRRDHASSLHETPGSGALTNFVKTRVARSRGRANHRGSRDYHGRRVGVPGRARCCRHGPGSAETFQHRGRGRGRRRRFGVPGAAGRLHSPVTIPWSAGSVERAQRRPAPLQVNEPLSPLTLPLGCLCGVWPTVVRELAGSPARDPLGVA
jgi:hypothetical protein